MPTGYTADIANDISFNDFVMGCARAFGALVTMRDDPHDAPIPDKFEPSKYHVEKLSEARAELVRLKAMTMKVAAQNAKSDFDEMVESHKVSIDKNNNLREKYGKMLALVNMWIPPTPEHSELKGFMQKQISESIEWDCSNRYFHENPPELMTAERWIETRIANALRDIIYHETENRKEIERNESRSLWVQQLRDSLKQPSA